MFLLRKKFEFCAAHYLPQHDGYCSRRHGHNFVGYVTLGGMTVISSGPKTGMVMDFNTIKEIIQPVIHGYLEHYDLNERLLAHPFRPLVEVAQNPTSEMLARALYKLWAPLFISGGAKLYSVSIEETCTCSVEYEE